MGSLQPVCEIQAEVAKVLWRLRCVCASTLDAPYRIDAPRDLLFAQYQIDDPAAADVFSRPAAVVQDVGVVAAGVFEGVGEDRQAVEGAVVVDGLGKGGDVRCSPGGMERDGAERVAEDVTNQIRLLEPLRVPRYKTPAQWIYDSFPR